MRVLTAIVVGLGVSLSAVPTVEAGRARLFDASLAPPPVLDGIRVGMPRAELARALAAFTRDDAYRDAAQRTRFVADVAGGAKAYVLFAGDVVARIGVEAPAAGLVAKLTELWGTPLARTNLANEGLVSWRAGGQRVDVACRERACRLAYHRELGPAFFGSEVGAPGALASVAMGTPRAQLPAMFATGAEVPAGVEDVRVVVDSESARGTERVSGVRVVGLPPTAGDALATAWGAPVLVDGKPTWFAPAKGLRAQYDAALGALRIAEYLPLAALLGGGDALALPVLGLAAKQLAAAYPRFAPAAGGGTIALPPTELAATPTLIGVAIEPTTGRVARATFAVPFGANKAAVLAALAAKWGTPRTTTRAGHTLLTFPAAKTRVVVEVDDAAGAVVVELSHG